MIPLVVRSHYSLLWGTASIRRLCQKARELGYGRLALTDTDNLYGLWPFLAECRDQGITPLIGAEVTDRATRKRAVCLVENPEGYKNLCRLLSRRHQAEDFNLERALLRLGRGLAILTRSPGLLTALCRAGLFAAAAVPRNPGSWFHPLLGAARRFKAPAVAVPGSFFLEPDEAPFHRMLRAIDQNTSLSRLPRGEAAPANAWLASPREYARRFAVCPELIRATHEIAERLAFTGPDFGTVMPPWTGKNGKGPVETLRALAYAGARKRYGRELPEPVVERLEHELAVIRDMGFSSYFLTVRDIVRKSPRICGRGSGAASLVAYSLGITNVCPVKHNLYFERFLNPGRKDPPDIDVDFAWDERDGVIASVLEKFAGRSAMVSSHILFQPRMALREAAKVHGLPDGEISRVTRRLPWFWKARHAEDSLLASVRKRPEAKALDFPRPWPEIMETAQRLLGKPRYLSVHPGGVVITPGPIEDYVPVERAPKGVPVIQWEKDGAEEAGLVKIDLLGNRSLGVIRDAVVNIRENKDPFPEDRWEPEDDFATQKALARGQTMGCFYIESPATRLLQQKARVGDFEHLVIHSSIIRPAANEFIREYVKRLHGAPWEPIHPLLDDVLAETFGIMVYQEDVSRAAVALAGFSHAQADALRKIMSKKDKERALRDFRERFLAGARSKGVPDAVTSRVWDMIASFSGYSFCKPHSASYARVSFQAAYLKVHHPAEFMAAVISNQGGFYGTAAYVSEAKRLGLAILPPDAAQSRERWTGQGQSLRVGLMAVKGLSRATLERVLAEREKRPYENPLDFFSRVRPEEPEARTLVDCGALDSLLPGGRRAGILWTWLQWRKGNERKKSAAAAFFETPALSIPAPDFGEEDLTARKKREFAALGFLCEDHPLVFYEKALEIRSRTLARELGRCVGKRVRMAGWCVTGKVVQTRRGEPMEFLTFEDETGIYETTFFPDAYRAFCHLVDRGGAYLLCGRADEDFGAVTLTVDRVERLEPDPDTRREALSA